MSEPIVKRRPMIDLEEFERRLRKPIAANPRDDDPLAELARSFAGEEVDPYKTVFEPLNRRPSGAWRNEQDRGDGRVQSARQPLIGGDFAAIEAGLLGNARHDSLESLSASDEAESYPQEGQEHWPYGDTEAPHEADTAYEEVRSRRPLYVMAAMIVAGIAGIGASFGFKGAVSNPTDIATIRAADGPTKIHPETVASTEMPDRDATVLGGAPQQPPVAAVNNVEQPADLSAQADASQAGGEPFSGVAGLASGAASVPVPPPPAQAQPQPPSDGIAALIEPKKVKTVSVRPDGTLLPNDAPPQFGAPAARPAAVSPAKAATPKSTARVATTPKPPAATPNASAEAARTSIAPKAKRVQVADAQDQVPGADAARAAPGSYAVQLAAPATEQEARDAQVRLMKKFGAELTGFHPSIHKAEVGGKPVYRVRVSGLSSRDEATALCEKIQGGGGRCFVAKN
jgi:hypothetical protein